MLNSLVDWLFPVIKYTSSGYMKGNDLFQFPLSAPILHLDLKAGH